MQHTFTHESKKMGDERKRNNSNKWTVRYDGIKTDGVYTTFQKFLVCKSF